MASNLWRFAKRRSSLVWLCIALVLLVVHVYADRALEGEASDRWLYYTRMGFYLLGFCALAALGFRSKRMLLGQLGILLALLCFAELVFYFARGCPPIEHRTYILPEYPPGHPGYYLGELPLASSVIADHKVHKGDTLYRANYTIDQDCRRVTPDHDSAATKHAIFFGCSVCFGQWLPDDATIAARFQQADSGLNAYNYSYPGWGMGQMLARLENQRISTQVPEREGIGVYVFIWTHVYRSIGDMHTYSNWGLQHPYYKLEDGTVVRHGRFKDGRPIISGIYEQLWKSNIVRFFELNLPPSLSERHIRLSVAIIKRSRQLFLEEFPNDRFVVLWAQDWPAPQDEKHQIRFKELLAQEGIDLVDARRPDKMDTEHYLVDDGHPTALADEEMAEILRQELLARGWLGARP